jgi:hypothetical protein
VGADGQVVDSGFDRAFYQYSTWHSFAVEAVGGRLTIRGDGALYYDEVSAQAPAAGRIQFVVDTGDVLWLDDCLVYRPIHIPPRDGD